MELSLALDIGTPLLPQAQERRDAYCLKTVPYRRLPMVLPAMMRTPWGDASELRGKMLPPGRGTPREDVERSQRERLFGAMVATVAEKGYEATTVADLVELSGVSRSAFYRHFAGRQACFLATIEALVQPALKIGAGELDLGDKARAQQRFVALIEWIVTQPSAARMCFDVHAAGPEGIALAERILDGLEVALKRLLGSIPGHEETPSGIVRALIVGNRGGNPPADLRRGKRTSCWTSRRSSGNGSFTTPLPPAR